jgi:manganese/zinc/iron transport system permease protein
MSINDVAIDWPTSIEIWNVLTLRGGFNTSLVLIGVFFLGIAGGVTGTFSLLRKRALVSDALAHSTLPGLGIAFILLPLFGLSSRNLTGLLLGATLTGVLGVLVVQFISRYTRLNEDAAIGAVLSVFFGVGIVILSIIQALGRGGEGGLHHLIYGQTASINQNDAINTAILAGIAILATVVFFKEFRLVCFDQAYARSTGLFVGLVDLIMMFIVILVTIIGLQTIGLILVVALLIIPATTARFWSDRLFSIVLIAGFFGGISGYIGAAASALFPRLPAGAVIVLVASSFFFISFLFAPNRGLIANFLRLIKLRFRVAEDHFLRACYEYIESNPLSGGVSQSIPIAKTGILRNDSFLVRKVVVFLCYIKGIVSRVDKVSVTLTNYGFHRAVKLIRSHRLWEEYLLTHVGVALSHVDYSADFAEHVLSPDIVSDIETSLRKKGRLPSNEVIPQSVHNTIKDGK